MPDLHSARILVVDDTEASRYAVGRVLQKARYTVVEAATGADALRLAAEGADLVILDISLPDMSGHDVCRQLKAAPATAHTPILHLSASFVGSEARAEGLEGGADGYLTYPLEPRELLANVEALLRMKRAEYAARAQGELLRVTLSSIADGVIACDMAGVITFINPMAGGLTGWGEGAVGRPVGEVFKLAHADTGGPAHGRAAEVLRTGSGAEGHSVLIACDGTRRPIEDSAAPMRDGDGRSVGVVLVFRDVTERRRLEEELRRRAEALVERDRRKDEFLAMLAHELRNPLAPVSNTLAILRARYGGDPDFRPAGEILERQVRHLARLIDDLMDVSRITKGKLELRKETVGLAEALARAAELVGPVMQERRHRLEVTPPGPDLLLRADPARLEQVLTNLLTNAAKYTPPGGHITLMGVREGSEAVVRVTDNGIGIRPEMMPRLFDMFQQADRVAGRVSEGLGLGLTLVRALAEMHGGGVTATSGGPGRGSEFEVRVPALPAGSASGLRPSPVRAAVRPVRVLITDDNEDALTSLAQLLRLSGHEVRTAQDGAEALAAVTHFMPEVALLDIGLPGGMDGYELARRLRAEGGLGGVMLVAMTGYGQPEDVARAAAAGFDGHITKPASLDQLLALLASVHEVVGG